MGVPAFFRWLSRKYPKIISPALEDDPIVVDGVELPASYSGPNKNGELDNLYLDMNGIVHPCTHPEGRPAPETEDEMMIEVFRYTDRVVSLARPRNILMIAVDGVAPRAKMNQQRSRRFRAAQDAKVAAEVKEQELEEARRRGEVIEEMIQKKSWDTNVITPGTPFMDFLATSLRYWVAYKLNSDPGWKNLKVIISDATVPGEGEHKIMNFIRSQRCDPQYNPNTSHCIYGLDADLIFLGLATHEPHFRVLREDVFQQNKVAKDQAAATASLDKDAPKPPKPYIWLDLGILRQYLDVELNIPGQGFPFDLERAIDDWIFMAFFCGNDFLPHLPSLDVRENGLDNLLWSWRRDLPKMRDYMTRDGDVDLKRVSMLLKGVASQEDDIFRKRHEQEERRERNERMRREQNRNRRRGRNTTQNVAVSKGKDVAPMNPLDNIPLYSTSGEIVGESKLDDAQLVAKRKEITLENDISEPRKKIKVNEEEEKKTFDQAVDVSGTGDEPMDTQEETEKQASADAAPPAEPQEVQDNVKLWEPGYHDRYYQNKFGINPNVDVAFVQEMVHKYIEGVCWVLKYYYQGCPSWTWYYPYHYAPFAQDMTELAGLKIEFEEGIPFLPYEQLMSVLPAASNHTLPKIFRALMSDRDSPIYDFYPEDFAIDMNGKKMAWQGIAILPFIDEQRLLINVRAKYPELTQAERERNVRKEPILLVSGESPVYDEFMKLYGDIKEFSFRSWKSKGLAGVAKRDVEYEPHKPLICPVQAIQFPDIAKDSSITVEYLIDEHSMHKSMLLQGVKLAENVLSHEQIEIIIHRRNKSDRRDERYDRREEARFQATDGYAEPRAKRAGCYSGFMEESRKQQDTVSSYQQGYNQGYGSYNDSYSNGGYRGGQSNYQGGYQGGYGGYQGSYQGGYQGGYNGQGSYPMPHGGYQGGYQGGYNGQGSYQMPQGGYQGGYQGNQGNYQGRNNNHQWKQPPQNPFN